MKRPQGRIRLKNASPESGSSPSRQGDSPAEESELVPVFLERSRLSVESLESRQFILYAVYTWEYAEGLAQVTFILCRTTVLSPFSR